MLCSSRRGSSVFSLSPQQYITVLFWQVPANSEGMHTAFRHFSWPTVIEADITMIGQIYYLRLLVNVTLEVLSDSHR